MTGYVNKAYDDATSVANWTNTKDSTPIWKSPSTKQSALLNYSVPSSNFSLPSIGYNSNPTEGMSLWNNTADTKQGYSGGVSLAAATGSDIFKLPEIKAPAGYTNTFSNKKENNNNNETPWYQNGKALQGWADIGGLALQLAGYSARKKQMNIQTAGLEQNLAQAKTNSAQKALITKNLGGVTT